MTNVVFFDWDGVIVNSEELIVAAYAHAGVWPPPDILSREGDTWLHDQVSSWVDRARVHAMKNEYYLKYIRDCDTLGGFEAAWRMSFVHQGEPQRAFVISGAPIATAFHTHHTMRRLFEHMAFGIRTPEKMDVFRGLAARGGDWSSCTYVDDQDKFIDLPPGWQFVRYAVGDKLEEIA